MEINRQLGNHIGTRGCCHCCLLQVVRAGSETTSFTWASAFTEKGFRLAAPQYDTETFPNCSGTTGTDNCMDASMEEVGNDITI